MAQGIEAVGESVSGMFANLPEGAAAVGLVGLLGVVALLFALVLVSRRQQRRDLREIVLAIEDLRAGSTRRRVEIDTRSPVAFVAEAVNRLGQDLGARKGEVETADAQLRALVDAASDYAVVVTDTDGDIHSFSSGASAMFGWEEEEVQGREASWLFEEESWKNLLAKLSRSSFRERGVETRTRMVRKDRTAFHAQVSVRWIRGAAGGGPGFLLLVKDISGQVRLEDELRESEARYRTLFQGLGEGVFVLQGGTIVLANPALATLCGTTVAQIEGTSLRDRLATRDLMVVQERLALLEARGGGEEEFRFALLGPGGKPAAVVRMKATAAMLGGRPAVLCLLNDESAARAAEAELRQNEARLDAVLEATSDGILVLEAGPMGGIVRMTNQAFLRMFALAAPEVLGASEGDLLRLLRERGEGAEGVAAFLASAIRGTQTEKLPLGGERRRLLELKASALAGPSGAPLGRILACRDITDQRDFEQRLQANVEALGSSRAALQESYARLQAVKEDLASRAEEQERLNRELKALDEMKSNLLANVSHELQTPLVSIRGYTEMILRERLGSITEEQRKGLALSLKNIDRLISMIDNLLAFTRLDKESAGVALQAFSLRPLVEESMEMLREKARPRRVGLSATFEDPDVVVRADRDKVLQVFVNLLSNAIKFNREGGRVEVLAGRGKPGFIQVQVTDTGIGVPREELERIFERHYQVKTSAESGEEGSGIGLSIVRDILRLHGCSIRAESREGQGSTFTFTLPLAREQRRRKGSESERIEAGPDRSSGVAARSRDGAPAPPPSPAPSAGPPPRFRIIRDRQAGKE